MTTLAYTFQTKQELLDSFTIYAMQSSGMDKASAQEYAKMMVSYIPGLGWVIRDYGNATPATHKLDCIFYRSNRQMCDCGVGI